MTRNRRAAVVLLLSAAAGACGDPSADGDAWSVRRYPSPIDPEHAIVDVPGTVDHATQFWVREDGTLGRRGGSVAAPAEGERFRRVTADGIALTSRGRLLRVSKEGTTDLGARVQAGSLLAAGPEGVWIAGEAGGLARLERDRRTVVEHWPTGDPPTSALLRGRNRVLVGRVTGPVEAADVGDPLRRTTLFQFESAVTALADSAEGGAAAADARGRVRVERPSTTMPAAWDAGAAVVALGFALDRGTAAGPVAVREDGVFVTPPGADGPPRTILRLGVPVRAASVSGGPGRVGFWLATSKGVRYVEIGWRRPDDR